MKLPDDCPFAKMSLRFPETEIHRLNCCRAGAGTYLIGTDEPPLCRLQETDPEAYRFIWQSSFDGDAVVYIARKGDSVGLRASRSSYSRLRLRVPLASVALSLDDWQKLQGALNASGFWNLEAADEEFGLDGARWLIEGRRGDTYHSIERWSPRGAVRYLGCLFFALAGPPLADVKLY
jgi:hypothetical protein